METTPKRVNRWIYCALFSRNLTIELRIRNRDRERVRKDESRCICRINAKLSLHVTFKSMLIFEVYFYSIRFLQTIVMIFVMHLSNFTRRTFGEHILNTDLFLFLSVCLILYFMSVNRQYNISKIRIYWIKYLFQGQNFGFFSTILCCIWIFFIFIVLIVRFFNVWISSSFFLRLFFYIDLSFTKWQKDCFISCLIRKSQL